MSTQDAERRFARNLFSGSDDDQGLDDDKQGQRSTGADDGLDEQRRFAADLFAPDDPDASILAGLTRQDRRQVAAPRTRTRRQRALVRPSADRRRLTPAQHPHPTQT